MHKLLDNIVSSICCRIPSFFHAISTKLYALVPIFLACLAWFTAPDLSHNGLTATYDDAMTRIERIAIVTANDMEPDSEHTIRWTGYLYQPQASEIRFRVPQNISMTLTICSDTVTEPSSQNTHGEVVVPTVRGLHPITLEITTPLQQSYYQAGLEWQTIFGWHFVPAVYLYPEPVDPQLPVQNLQRYFVSAILWGLSGAALIGWGLLWIVAHFSAACRSPRCLLALSSLIFLAFILRLGFLHDYATQPSADFLMLGSDHRGYQHNAIDLLRGLWPPQAPFYVQPGISLFLGTVYFVAGVNIRLVQVIQMVGGAMTTVLVFDITRRMVKKEEMQQSKIAGLRPEWIAAILWAIFPLPIFYEAQLLTHGLEPQLGALIVWLWMIVIETTEWRHVALLGIVLGLSAVVRPTFLMFAPIIALSIAWQRQASLKFTHIAILALFTCLSIAPITWHNYSVSGQFQLLNSSSGITFYLGNNRSSTGLGEYSPDFWATQNSIERSDTTFASQALTDIATDPKRWIELMLRKTALYLGDAELPNNVDFYREGANISPLLNALPLRFGAMLTLGLAGIWLTSLVRLSKMSRYVIIVYMLAHIAVTITYHVFSRFRAPIYSVLPVMGAWAVWWVINAAAERRPRHIIIGIMTIGAMGIVIGAMPWLAETVMARPIVASLPSSATPLNIPFNDSLTLLGYESPSMVKPGQPMFVTLYWRGEKLMDDDLTGTVQLLNDGYKVAQTDQKIGEGGFPDYLTSQWQVNQIVWDRYYIPIPDDVDVPISPSFLVAIYHHESGQRMAEASFGLVAITDAQASILDWDVIHQINARVGTATLLAYRISSEQTSLTITLYWQAADPMPEDGIVFIHIHNPDGEFVLGQDQRPCGGRYWTQAWQSGEVIVDEHLITLPSDLSAGRYDITIGMYDSQNQNRWLMTLDGNEVTDNILPLGEFTITH